jgi:preprotein translocase subunit YajC
MMKMFSAAAAPLLFAQTASPSPFSGLSTPVIIAYGLMFVAMYFLMIAPQRKKAKELQKMIESLQAGDEVLTTGGIYGQITNKKDDRFVVRISENTKVEIARGFIQTVVKKTGEEKSK